MATSTSSRSESISTLTSTSKINSLTEAKEIKRTESSAPSKRISDFIEVVETYVKKLAAENGTSHKWITYSTEELKAKLGSDYETHQLMKGTHQLLLQSTEPPRIDEMKIVGNNAQDTISRHTVVVDNALPIPYEKKDIQVKDTINSAWKETEATSKTFEATASLKASVPGLTEFQATLKGALTKSKTVESSFGRATEISTPLSIILPKNSHNEVEITRELLLVKRTVEAKAALTGAIVVCFNNKIKLPEVGAGNHKKWAVPLKVIFQKIDEYKIDHTGFDVDSAGSITFTQRVESESTQSVKTSAIVKRSDPLPEALRLTQINKVEDVKSVEESINHELTSALRTLIADGGSIKISSADPDKTIKAIMELGKEVTERLFTVGFFSANRSNISEHMIARNGGSITIGTQQTTEENKAELQQKTGAITSPAKK